MDGKIKISKEKAAEHLEVLWRAGAIGRTIDGCYMLFCKDETNMPCWTAQKPDEAAEALSSNMASLDELRTCMALYPGVTLPKIDKLYLSAGEETYEIASFDCETPLGEPQAWINLGDNTSLEITHEENLLAPENQHFSLRHHCREEDFENDVYHSTMGTIEECSGGLSDIEPMLVRLITESGIIDKKVSKSRERVYVRNIDLAD